MPTPLIKSFAEKTHHTKEQVEKIWDETKTEAKDKFGEESPEYWAYVNAVVQRKLGIKKKSFKEFVKDKNGK